MSVRTLKRLEEKLADGVELEGAGGRSRSCAGSRTRPSWPRSPPPPSSPTTSGAGRWSAASRGAASATSPAPPRRGSASSAPSRPSRRSSPPGPNGALPHAEPGEREIGRGELVVFDMGAKLDGYCSDGTRTFATGEPGERAREVYEMVRAAQAAALEAVVAGVEGEDGRRVARELIAAAGHGERFGHGLGHGVGLEVHEAPRVSQRSEDVLAAGEVVTVEPGVYLPGELGVRIEDLVVVTESGHRNLSGLPKTCSSSTDRERPRALHSSSPSSRRRI